MDATEICRVCMEDDSDSFTSLYDDDPPALKVTPGVMIVECTGIEVEKGDGLPESICGECLKAINDAYKIRSKCRNTDRKLRKILGLVGKTATSRPVVSSGGEDKVGTVVEPVAADCSVGEKDTQDVVIEEKLPPEEPVLEESSEQPVPDVKVFDAQPIVEESETLSPESPPVDDPEQQEKSDGTDSPSEICLEIVQQSLVEVKQEGKTHSAYDEEYLVEELKDCVDLVVPIDEPELKPSDPTQIADDLDCAEESPTTVLTVLEDQVDETSIDEGDFFQMKVETLEEDDEYEDYEAIDEEFEIEDLEDTQEPPEGTNCCGCAMEFTTRAELDDHSRSVHLPDKVEHPSLQDCYVCDICYKMHSSLKALNLHKTARSNKKLRTCSNCQLVMNSVRRKRNHEQLHKLLPKNFEVNCCGCDQLVPFSQLGTHSENIHRKADQTLPSSSKYVCEICFLDCGFKQRLDSHQSKQAIPGVSARKQPKLDNNTFTALTADIDGRKRFICDICGRNFSTKGNLKSHHSLHAASDKPFKCSLCDKEFSKKSNYNVHILRAHTTTDSYACSVCGKTFKCAANLKTHMRVHTKEQPYGCSFCPRRFAHLSDKRRHEILHSGNYPYRCDLCTKPFTRKTLLDKHSEHCGKRRISKKKPPAATKTNKVAAPAASSASEPIKTEDTAETNLKSILPCDLCNEWFASVEDLTEHHAEMHIQTLDESTYDNEIEIE